MKTFIDKNGARVNLVFAKNQFNKQTNHVIILSDYKNKWLLTNHRLRGLEFPGGKREPGETIEAAAHREVFEETGAKISHLKFIGEYEVCNGADSFVKAIFYAQILEINVKEDYLETNGPVLVEKDQLIQDRFQNNYSFIMQDDLLDHVFNELDHGKII